VKTVHQLPDHFREIARRLPQVQASAAQDLATRLEERGQTNFRSRLRSRSGRALASITGTMTQRSEVIEVALTAGEKGALDYVRTLEGPNPGGGGVTVIRPVNAEFLTIPVGPVLTGAGVARYKSPRTDPEVVRVVINRERTKGVMLGRNGEVRWALTKGPIVIKGRRFLGDAWDALIRDFPALLERDMAETVEGVLRG